MGKKLTQVIILFAVVLCLLSGCAVVKYSGYEPLDGSIKVPWSHYVSIESNFHCSPQGVAVPASRMTQHPEGVCTVQVMLQGSSLIDFRFSNRQFILREADGDRRQFVPIDQKTYEREFSVDIWRWVNIRYHFPSPPKRVELIIPEVEINSVMYELPVIRFEYRERTETQHLLNWGG